MVRKITSYQWCHTSRDGPEEIRDTHQHATIPWCQVQVVDVEPTPHITTQKSGTHHHVRYG